MMTTYSHRERRRWRTLLRYLRSRFNCTLAVLALALLLRPSVANAGPRCPGSLRPDATGQCVRQIDHSTVCVWPTRIDGRPTTVCVRQAVQP
jgi:hypothetical protein